MSRLGHLPSLCLVLSPVLAQPGLPTKDNEITSSERFELQEGECGARTYRPSYFCRIPFPLCALNPSPGNSCLAP